MLRKCLANIPGARGLRLKVLTASLRKAAQQQGLSALGEKLAAIVPDISDQYTHTPIDSPFVLQKVRNQHAFQISLVDEVIGEFDSPVIVDIGDSCGTHIQYVNALYPDKNVKSLSVNLEQAAVDRIAAKGLEAICSRAEELEDYNIKTDIFLCFETLEHMMDPCHFLKDLSDKTDAKYLVITVPYVAGTRAGLRYVRGTKPGEAYAENTHIFEFCPEDLKLLARHSGWDVHSERIYRQYPRWSWLRITRGHWKKFDFEGFYGLILKRDHTWSDRYVDW